mmetsp:Transcript_82617/g.191959  ORF Transcript_82617/g.191959 Transcript_82617/m.191959 type:complete len:230 (+) Transcript_82617:35-724(+)
MGTCTSRSRDSAQVEELENELLRTQTKLLEVTAKMLEEIQRNSQKEGLHCSYCSLQRPGPQELPWGVPVHPVPVHPVPMHHPLPAISSAACSDVVASTPRSELVVNTPRTAPLAASTDKLCKTPPLRLPDFGTPSAAGSTSPRVEVSLKGHEFWAHCAYFRIHSEATPRGVATPPKGALSSEATPGSPPSIRGWRSSPRLQQSPSSFSVGQSAAYLEDELDCEATPRDR